MLVRYPSGFIPPRGAGVLATLQMSPFWLSCPRRAKYTPVSPLWNRALLHFADGDSAPVRATTTVGLLTMHPLSQVSAKRAAASTTASGHPLEEYAGRTIEQVRGSDPTKKSQQKAIENPRKNLENSQKTTQKSRKPHKTPIKKRKTTKKPHKKLFAMIRCLVSDSLLSCLGSLSRFRRCSGSVSLLCVPVIVGHVRRKPDPTCIGALWPVVLAVQYPLLPFGEKVGYWAARTTLG